MKGFFKTLYCAKDNLEKVIKHVCNIKWVRKTFFTFLFLFLSRVINPLITIGSETAIWERWLNLFIRIRRIDTGVWHISHFMIPVTLTHDLIKIH